MNIVRQAGRITPHPVSTPAFTRSALTHTPFQAGLTAQKGYSRGIHKYPFKGTEQSVTSNRPTKRVTNSSLHLLQPHATTRSNIGAPCSVPWSTLFKAKETPVQCLSPSPPISPFVGSMEGFAVAGSGATCAPYWGMHPTKKYAGRPLIPYEVICT
jgi:hypothetical protein